MSFRAQGRRVPLYWYVPLLGLLSLCASIAGAQNFQSWNEVDLAATWRRVDFLAPFVARIDTSLPNPQLAASGITADLQLRRHLTLTPGYLFADLPQGGYFVHLPLIAVTEAFRPGRFTLADRNRFEKLIGFPRAPLRYRNRWLLDYPFGPRDRAHTFIDDEVFFNLSAGNFNQNRFQAGAGLHVSSRLLFDLYYLSKKPASGASTNVLGSTLRVTLTRHPQEITARRH